MTVDNYMEQSIFKITNWVDNQPLINGKVLVWYFENNTIKTIII